MTHVLVGLALPGMGLGLVSIGLGWVGLAAHWFWRRPEHPAPLILQLPGHILLEGSATPWVIESAWLGPFHCRMVLASVKGRRALCLYADGLNVGQWWALRQFLARLAGPLEQGR